MIHLQSPFPHHFLQVAVAQGVAQIPTHAEENNLGFKVTPFQRILLIHEGNSSAVLEYRRVYHTASIFATQPVAVSGKAFSNV
jgi:hypothetical protein